MAADFPIDGTAVHVDGTPGVEASSDESCDIQMKALITGAGGFVGPHLAAHLLDSGDTVMAYDASNGPDLRDRQGWVDLVADRSPEAIYHLAGWSDVGASWKDPSRTFEINALGTQNVLEAARLAGVGRVLVVSSADVYGLASPDELPLTEDRLAQPRSPYGVSKQATEALALQYHRGFGVDVAVARPFNHLGPGQSIRFAAPAFAHQIAEAERRREPTKLRHGDLSAKRDLTDVRDVVRAYRLLASTAEPGQVYNVCSEQAVSMQEVLSTLLSLSEATVNAEPDPARYRPIDLPVLCGSAAKLTAATGWKPAYSLTQTLSDVLNDARDQSPLPTDQSRKR